MTYEMDGGGHTFACDKCGDSETEEGDFSDVWGDLKDVGWRAFRNDDGDWEHRCPVCRGAPW